MVLSSACNRKPLSCVEASPNTVQLGQETVITDCSENSFNNELKTGEGGNFSNITSKTWSYFRPGTYNISLKAFSKRGNKDDTYYQNIHVVPPDSNKVKGRWRLTTFEQREQLFVDYSINLFENPLILRDTLDETYTITGDSLFVKHDTESFLLFLNEYAIDYDYQNATIQAGESFFEIVLFEDTRMVWKGSYVKGYSLLYLSRV
ncbi:MAG: hypothetical protein CL840_01960 [Crocinitomicaceae bacterium]|nr:hypothetical protein [Crocinitomicaceae bacterium]